MHLGTPDEADAFLGERWPEARAVSDPDRKLYRAFGLGRWSVFQLFAPRVLLAGLRARGFGVGKPVGDPMARSGWFLVEDGRVTWSQVHAHAGEARRFDELVAAYARG
ncbi:MAG: hypothetical protein P1V81_15745 [Planctomycetota bacterium]|nr:hypothetical protein [Planctomycetota bacterium]